MDEQEDGGGEETRKNQMAPVHGFGQTRLKKDTVQLVSKSAALFCVGSHAVVADFETKVQTFLPHGGSGIVRRINAIATDPKRRHAAVCEGTAKSKGEDSAMAQVSVYTLSKGFKRARTLLFPPLHPTHSSDFSLASFSTDSKFLVCQTGPPSFTVVCWDWLRSRRVFVAAMPAAWSQISLNPLDYTQICTSGVNTLGIYKSSEETLKAQPALNGLESGEDYSDHAWTDDDRIVATTRSGKVVVIDEMEQRQSFAKVLEGGRSCTSLCMHANGFIVAGEGGCIAVFELSDVTDRRGGRRRFVKVHHVTPTRAPSGLALGLAAAGTSGSGQAAKTAGALGMGGSRDCDITSVSIAPVNASGVITLALAYEAVGEIEIVPLSALVGSVDAAAAAAAAAAANGIGGARPQTPQPVRSHAKGGCHQAPVKALSLCARKRVMATCSAHLHDASVRIWRFGASQDANGGVKGAGGLHAGGLLDRDKDDYLHPTAMHTMTFDGASAMLRPISVSFHPAGNQLLVAFVDRIRIYHLAADELRLGYEVLFKHVLGATFSPGGNMFSVVSGKQVFLYCYYSWANGGSPALSQTLSGHASAITALAWAANDLGLHTISQDGAIYEWRVGSLQRVKEALLHDCAMTNVAVDPRGGSLAVAGMRVPNVAHGGGDGNRSAAGAGGEAVRRLMRGPGTTGDLNAAMDSSFARRSHASSTSGEIEAHFPASLRGPQKNVLRRSMSTGGGGGGAIEDGQAVLFAWDGHAGVEGQHKEVLPPDNMRVTAIMIVPTEGPGFDSGSDVGAAGRPRANSADSVDGKGTAGVLVVGTDAGSVLLYPWPLPANHIMPQREIGLHSAALTALHLSPDTSLALTTGEDGASFVLDLKFGGSRCSSTDATLAAARARAPEDDGGSTGIGVRVSGEDDLVLTEHTVVEDARESLVDARQQLESVRAHYTFQLEVATSEAEAQKKSMEDEHARVLEEENSKFLHLEMEAKTASADAEREMSRAVSQNMSAAEDMERLYERKLAQQATQYQEMQDSFNDLAVAAQDDAEELKQTHTLQRCVMEEKMEMARKENESEQNTLKGYNSYVKDRYNEVLSQQEDDHDAEVVKLRGALWSEQEARGRESKKNKGDMAMLKRQNKMLRGELEGRDLRVNEFKQAVDTERQRVIALEGKILKLGEDARKELRRTSEWEATCGVQRRQIEELARARKVLTHQLHELRQQVEPKERTIGEMREQIRELDEENEKSMRAGGELDTKLSDKSRRLSNLSRQQGAMRRQLANRDKLLRRLAADICELHRSGGGGGRHGQGQSTSKLRLDISAEGGVEIVRDSAGRGGGGGGSGSGSGGDYYKEGFLRFYNTYEKSLNAFLDGNEPMNDDLSSGEVARQRRYMEAGLTKLTEKLQSQRVHAREKNAQQMEDSSFLMVELNELRQSNKMLRDELNRTHQALRLAKMKPIAAESSTPASRPQTSSRTMRRAESAPLAANGGASSSLRAPSLRPSTSSMGYSPAASHASTASGSRRRSNQISRDIQVASNASLQDQMALQAAKIDQLEYEKEKLLRQLRK